MNEWVVLKLIIPDSFGHFTSSKVDVGVMAVEAELSQ